MVLRHSHLRSTPAPGAFDTDIPIDAMNSFSHSLSVPGIFDLESLGTKSAPTRRLDIANHQLRMHSYYSTMSQQSFFAPSCDSNKSTPQPQPQSMSYTMASNTGFQATGMSENNTPSLRPEHTREIRPIYWCQKAPGMPYRRTDLAATHSMVMRSQPKHPYADDWPPGDPVHSYAEEPLRKLQDQRSSPQNVHDTDRAMPKSTWSSLEFSRSSAEEEPLPGLPLESAFGMDPRQGFPERLFS